MIISFFLDSRKGGPHVYHKNIIEKFKLKSKNIYLDQKNFFNFKTLFNFFFIMDVLLNSFIIYFKFKNYKCKIFFVYSCYNLAPIIAGFLFKKKIVWFLIEKPKYLIKIIFNLIPKKKIKFVVINNEVAKKLKIKNYRIFIPKFNFRNKKKINKKNIIITVGNLNRVKNHIFLVNAFKNIENNYKLFILGRKLNTQMNYYKKLKNVVRLSKNISLLGHKNSSDVKRYLSSSKFFILPSTSEGLSVALIEAINFNCLCLVSKNSNTSKLIKHNFNGFIFDLNINSFKSCFEKAIKLSNKKRSVLIRNSQHSLKKFYQQNNLSYKFLTK